MMLIDSHCHIDCLNLTPYHGDLGALLNAAKSVGVAHFLCPGINLERFPRMIEIAEQYDTVSAAVGLHPQESVAIEPRVDDLLHHAINLKVVAIGETGLDYYRCTGDLTWQRERFRCHIRAARTVKKPLIIHTRDAREDTLRIMREEHAEDVGGVMHCFTENIEMAKQAIDLNFYISFSGIITFKNATALQEVATHVPLERLLIETDAPYLAPVPVRGKPNEPAYVRYVAESLAVLRNESYVTIAQVTTDNYLRLFGGSSVHAERS